MNAPVSRVASQSADVESIQAEQAGRPSDQRRDHWWIRPSMAASLVGLGSTIGVRCLSQADPVSGRGVVMGRKPSSGISSSEH
jgi:hypothetical protein